MEQKIKKVLVIGAGYAGLACSYELVKHNIDVVLVEKTNSIGGLSSTVTLKNIKFELGPHIYFNKDKVVNQLWKELIGDKLKSYKRNNKIFYKGKFIDSPLNIFNVISKIGVLRSISYLISFMWYKFLKFNKSPNNSKEWVIFNFGKKLYDDFFMVFNEKIWGLKCEEISVDWTGQRIKSSLYKIVAKSLLKDEDFIIKTFDFPDGGSETIYNAFLTKLLHYNNFKLYLNTNLEDIITDNFCFKVNSNNFKNFNFTDIISTIHLSDLNDIIKSNLINKDTINDNINNLKYRNLIIVNFVFKKEDVQNFQEHWIDIHDSSIKALRVTNFGNYNFGLSNDKNTGIGVEYNCFESDDIWHLDDLSILKLALNDLKYMNLINQNYVDFKVIKISKAYPIYFDGYKEFLNPIINEFIKINNLQLVGRNSMYKWNNMHHSVKTGILAAKNILGENYDLNLVRGMVSFGKETD